LWGWEIELALEWMEEVGVARRMNEGTALGWTTGEWWWMVFAQKDDDEERMMEQQGERMEIDG